MKKFFGRIAGLSVLAGMLLAVTVSAVTTQSVFLTRGDVNGDGAVDTSDVTLLQEIMDGSRQDNGRADVDGNHVAERKDLAVLQALLEGTLPIDGDLMDHVTDFELTDVTPETDSCGMTMQAAVVRGDSNRAVKVWASNAAQKPVAVLRFDETQDWSGFGTVSFDSLLENMPEGMTLQVSLLSGDARYAYEGNPVTVPARWSTTTLYLDDFPLLDKSKIQGLCVTADFDGTTEQALYMDNIVYTPGAMQRKLWDFEDHAGQISMTGTAANRNTSYLTDAAGYGVGGSVALKYALGSEDAITTSGTNKQTDSITQTLTVNLESYGVDDFVVASENDIFWFWVDGAMSTTQRLLMQFNGGSILSPYGGAEDVYVYTIANVQGVPTMQKVDYSADGAGEDADGIQGLDLVNANPNTQKGTYSILRLSGDWSGWVGIPVKLISGVSVGTQITKLTMHLRQFEPMDDVIAEQNTGDAVYLDEFWLTGADTMPRVAEEDLLYTGTAQPPKWTQIWSLEEHSGKVLQTGSRANRNDSCLEAVDGYGVEGSVALKYYMKTEDAVTNTGTNIYDNSITQTLTVNLADYGMDSFTVGAKDDIFWFWVDADLSTSQRLLMQLNDSGIVSPQVAGVSEAYIYTIVNDNGVPALHRVDYRADTDGKDIDGIDGLDLLNGNPYTDRAGTSLIRLSEDWSGWVGIPVNMLVGELAPGTEITKFSVYLRQFEPVDGYIKDQNAGDGVYLDEFWLTSAGKMPKLSQEVLLYTGKATAAQRNSVKLLSFADGAADMDISAESDYVYDNTPDTAYSTLRLTDGKGYQGKNALTVTMTADGKVSDWWFVDTAAMPKTVATACNTPFTELLENTALEDLMLWIWVDGTALTEDARINMGIYTGGVKYTQEKQYYVDAFGQVQEMYLSVNSTGTGLIDSNVRGRITVDAGTAGWVGIPVSRFGTGLTALGELRFSIHKGIDRNNGNAATSIYTGDSISIGDIWLSKKDADGNWTAPLPARNSVTLSTEYYTAQDYLEDPALFVPAWQGSFTVPEEMLNWEEKFSQFFDPDGRAMSVGHRGDRNGLYPENSIEAFLSVIEAGVDIIEVDVIKTADGIPIALHGGGTSGNDLLAVTNLSQLRAQGIAYHLPASDLATDWTLEEIRQLRLMHKGNVTDYVIPTLEEIILAAKERVFVTLDKFHRFDWTADILPLIEKTQAYETVMIPYNYFRNKSYETVVEYIDQLKALGARNVAVMTEAYDTDIATVTKNLQKYSLPLALRLHEFTPADADYLAAYTPYAGSFRMYAETLTNANDNADVWEEMADNGFNIIMSNTKPYDLCRFIAERYFSES